MVATPVEALERLRRLWSVEREASRVAQREARELVSFAERVASGTALSNLVFHHRDRAKQDGVTLWFTQAERQALNRHRLHAGQPALLWRKTAKGTHSERGVVVRWTPQQIAIRFEASYERFIEAMPVQLDGEDSEVTFDRGNAALSAFATNDDLTSMRDLLFGQGEPEFEPPDPDLSFRDPGLNRSQQQAVRFAISARQVALIHGPPGTGKTRTLVEVVRQGLQRDHRILVTAPSNTAVDNLAERLTEAGVKALRLGQASRISPGLSEQSLSRKLAASPERAQADELRMRAQELEKKAPSTRQADTRKKAGALRREAHLLLAAARAKILRRARVVCCTAAGVDAVPLGDERFDLVVLDEATQAPDPVALSALQRGGVLVLAGDPQQLPPTVLSQEAISQGLASTLFERLSERLGAKVTHMLDVQYRMHAQLMAFPSQSLYDGRLIAAEANRAHQLSDLPQVKEERPLRPSPWLVLDTSPLGASERLSQEGGSQSHPEQAALAASEVKRLLARGVSPRDVAAITPYQGQVALLKELLADELRAGLEVGTVDGFQGREKEAVVVDLVRANRRGEIGFLNDVRRTNVALTRAKRFLLVIAHVDTLKSHPYYRALFEAAERSGALVRVGAKQNTP